MANISKIKDDSGTIHYIEDSQARSDIEDLRSAIETAQAVEIYAQGTSLVINTELVNGNEVSF